MKQLMIAIVLFFCMSSSVQSAEISATTKRTEAGFLCAYNSNPAPDGKFFALIQEEDENKRNQMLSSDRSLNLFFHAQKNGILILGNKNIGWDTFQKLTQQQQIKLITICNQDPYYSCCMGTSNKLFCNYACTLKCCGCSDQETYFEMLKSLPDNIKKDLVVDFSDNLCSLLWGSTVLPGICLSGPAFCCESGACIASGFIPPAIGAVVALALYGAERVKQQFYSKKYYVDRDLVSNQ